MRRGGLIGLIIAIAGFATVIVLAVVVVASLRAQPGGYAVALSGSTAAPNPPAPDPAAPAGPARPAPPPIAGQPLVLSVPSVGLTTRVGSIRRPSTGAIDPPSASIPYWISSYGVAGPDTGNTVYIAGHSCHGKCHAIFNAFLDIPNSGYAIHQGDKVYIGALGATYSYTVTDTALYDKPTLQNQAALWQKVPNRLVLITCFQYNGGTSSQQNFVVYAQLDASQ